jgi:hypothetical protein
MNRYNDRIDTIRVPFVNRLLLGGDEVLFTPVCDGLEDRRKNEVMKYMIRARNISP